jgi:hypothetical protein
MKAESKFPIYMPQSFEKMDDAGRQEWRRELHRRGQNPGVASYIDPSLESVYEFRRDLNATVEKSPDGQRFIVVFHDGQLSRQKPLEKEQTSSGWAPSWSFVRDFETVTVACVIAFTVFGGDLIHGAVNNYWLGGMQSGLAVSLLVHLIGGRWVSRRKRKSESEPESSNR